MKRRPPLSIHAALADIADTVPGGWDAMAAECSPRKPAIVRAWGDPDRREEIPLECAIKLDKLFRRSGGDGAPCIEYFAFRLDEAGFFHSADNLGLGRIAAELIRECGQAQAALVLAAQPGACRTVFREALVHMDEALEEYQTARVVVTAMANGGRLTSPSMIEDLAGVPRATGPPTL
ncbi:hypothetical protein [Sphingomonas sp. LH128]|uniref:hypothetical protein n=1 Tax=Sphingomonas sp. LH128 TaxID=473781 RepID=UPI00031CA973|nr:hypothetical protein [Sphingomonas sp. LH128]